MSVLTEVMPWDSSSKCRRDGSLDRAWWYAARASNLARVEGMWDCTLSLAHLADMMALRTLGSRWEYLMWDLCVSGFRVTCRSFDLRPALVVLLVEGLAVEVQHKSALVQTFHRVSWALWVRSPRNFRL